MSKRTRVIITRGMPGSGKNEYIKAIGHSELCSIVACSADAYFMQDGEYRFDVTKLVEAHDSCFRHFVMMCIDRSVDIIAVANTNAQLFEISPYLMYARTQGLEVEIHECFIPDALPEDYEARNIHGVPLVAIQGMMSAWEELPPFWPHPTNVAAEGGMFTIFDTKAQTCRKISI